MEKSVTILFLYVDVNGLNDKFVNINVPTPHSNIYNDLCFVPLENPFSFRYVNQLEVLESSMKSDAVGSDDLDPLFLKALSSKLNFLLIYSIQFYLCQHSLMNGNSRRSFIMKSRRCITSLAVVVDDLKLKLDENYITFIVLRDHTKFDTVDHKILLKKLQTLSFF